MRFGIFADIHSNLEAFRVVINELKKKKIDKYICLGDIVGYNSNPNECIKLIKDNFILKGKNKNFFGVIGNHDARCFDWKMGSFTKEASMAIEWTKKELTKENLEEFLKKLPLFLKINDFFIVHASPKNPQDMDYLTKPSENFKFFKQKFCFYGHTHIPQISCNKSRCLINPGSVGQPRDGDPRASYCIYDDTLDKIKIIRAKYNLKVTQKKNSKAGLPERLNKTLESAK